MTTILNVHQLKLQEHQPIRCVLEMTDDGDCRIIVRPGCSVPDVHDMLAYLSYCGRYFEHLTFVDADEDLM